MFYNIYVAKSITRQGRSAISSSIMLFESILSNNVLFGSLTEIVTFIDNIRNEKTERKYSDRDVLDRNISLSECFLKVMSTCGYNWIPTREEGNMIWDILSRVSQVDLNRIYYKNNLYEFCDNSHISQLLIAILSKLRAPFLDPNHPPKYIKDELEEFISYLYEYVYYHYQIIDKIERIEVMPRNVVLITDTDSCIISLEPWYRYVLEKTKGVDMSIKKQIIDIVDYRPMDEFGDRDLPTIVERVDESYEYDFYNEKLIEQQRLINPLELIPQDGLRHSIINIMSYSISKLILDYMYRYTVNYQSAAENRKCLLIMKNEFLFKSILLTGGKKNYASIQEVQEGNLVPKSASLAISGLPLDKVGIAESTSKELKRILYEEILDSQKGIDQVKVLKDIAILERKIHDSIRNGETKYHKPARIKPISAYSEPMHMQGIKAAVAYNALRTEGEDAINLENRNSIIIVKTAIDKNSIYKIEMQDKEMFEKMKKLISTKEYKGEITAVAIPYGADIPNWIIPFIDYTTIIHDNLSSFPIASVGISTLNSANVPYTNILEL